MTNTILPICTVLRLCVDNVMPALEMQVKTSHAWVIQNLPTCSAARFKRLGNARI